MNSESIAKLLKNTKPVEENLYSDEFENMMYQWNMIVESFAIALSNEENFNKITFYNLCSYKR